MINKEYKQTIIEENIMLPYSRYIASLEAENALRRSRVENELSLIEQLRRSRVQCEIGIREELRRSRIESQDFSLMKQKQEALRRSRIGTEIARKNNQLRKSRMEQQIQRQLFERQEAVRRSRVAADKRMSAAQFKAQQRRVKLQAQITAEKANIQKENTKAIGLAKIRAEVTAKKTQQKRNKMEKQIDYQETALAEILNQRQLQLEIAAHQVHKNQALRRSRVVEEALRRSRVYPILDAERRALAIQDSLTESMIARKRIERQLDDAYLHGLYRY